MQEDVERAKRQYRELLRLPLGSMERRCAHSHMIFLRDIIADSEGRPPKEVQDEYESENDGL